MARDNLNVERLGAGPVREWGLLDELALCDADDFEVQLRPMLPARWIWLSEAEEMLVQTAEQHLKSSGGQSHHWYGDARARLWDGIARGDIEGGVYRVLSGSRELLTGEQLATDFVMGVGLLGWPKAEALARPDEFGAFFIDRAAFLQVAGVTWSKTADVVLPFKVSPMLRALLRVWRDEGGTLAQSMRKRSAAQVLGGWDAARDGDPPTLDDVNAFLRLAEGLSNSRRAPKSHGRKNSKASTP